MCVCVRACEGERNERYIEKGRGGVMDRGRGSGGKAADKFSPEKEVRKSVV